MSIEFERFHVGMRESKWATGFDGGVIEFGDNGLLLYVFLKAITEKELDEYTNDSRFNLRFSIIENICFFVARFGKGGIFDLPFSPSIYEKPALVHELALEQGIALTVFIIDSSVGELKNIRFIGLGHDISVRWQDWYTKALRDKIEMDVYNKKIDEIYSNYSLEDLQAMSIENSYSC